MAAGTDCDNERARSPTRPRPQHLLLRRRAARLLVPGSRGRPQSEARLRRRIADVCLREIDASQDTWAKLTTGLQKGGTLA